MHEMPTKKMKVTDHRHHEKPVQLHLIDHNITSSDESFPSYSLLKKQLGGEKVQSNTIDLKLIHTIPLININSMTVTATSVVTCSKKKELLVGGTDKTIRIFDLESRELKRVISIDPFIPVRMIVDEEGEFVTFTTNLSSDWSIVRFSLLGEGKLEWEIFKDKSSKCDLIFKKDTNEIFVANWKGRKILVLNATDGSLKYEISNEKTVGVQSLYYDEKTDSLYAFTSLYLYACGSCCGKYLEKCYLLRLSGERYVNFEVVIEFDEEEFQLNNHGFTSIVMNLNFPYYLISKRSLIYLFDRNTKKLVTSINTEHDQCTYTFLYSYCELNNELYKFGGYSLFLEVLKPIRVGRNHIDIPLSRSICESARNLGGILPKKIDSHRYNTEYMFTDSLAYFMKIKFPPNTMFMFNYSIEEGGEEEPEVEEVNERVDGVEENEEPEEDPEDEQEDSEDEQEEEKEEEEPHEMQDDGEEENTPIDIDIMSDENHTDDGYSDPFPFKYSYLKDSANNLPTEIQSWLNENVDGFIIGGNFNRNDFENNDFAVAVKILETDVDDFPVYILNGMDQIECKLSKFLESLKPIDCFDMKTYHLPNKARYQIDFKKIYNELLLKNVINAKTKEIDINILLNAYRKLTTIDDESINIFTICSTIFKDEKIEFENVNYRKSDLLVLMFALGIKAIQESCLHRLLSARFADQDYDDVFC